jgi:hypothetical protein
MQAKVQTIGRSSMANIPIGVPRLNPFATMDNNNTYGGETRPYLTREPSVDLATIQRNNGGITRNDLTGSIVINT